MSSSSDSSHPANDGGRRLSASNQSDEQPSSAMELRGCISRSNSASNAICMVTDQQQEESHQKQTFLSSKHSKSILSHISSMYGDVETSDILLIVGSSLSTRCSFPAHQIVIAQSPVFKTMFYGNSWRESSAKEVQLNEIEQYVSAFEHFLKYLYGKALCITWRNVEALVYYGDKYAVDSLLNECLDFFYHHVEVSGDLLSALNGWKTIRRILTQRQNTDCLNVLKSILFSNIELIMKDENIVYAMDEDDIMAIVSSDEIVCRTEFSIFKLLEHWLTIKTAESSRLAQLLKFTPFLRLPYMHVQEMSYVESSPRRLFTDDASDAFKVATSTIKSLLCDAYKFHVICKLERDELMSLPSPRLYLDGSSCMKYRLLNTDGLSSWSKMDSYFKVKNSMSNADVTSREWGFCVTLMRKINVRRQLQSPPEKQRVSLLSLEISQNFCGPSPFKYGVAYIHERRGDSTLRRPLTRFDLATTRMKSDIMLDNINFEDVIIKNSLYQYPDELGNLIFLALDIFLLE